MPDRRLIIDTASSRTASANSNTLSVGNFTQGIIFLNVTAASGTTPTLNVKLQTSDDNGTTWYDLPSGAFTQATAVSTGVLQFGPNTPFGDTIRAVSTIGGTTPSFSYTVKAVFK